jgi:hypothetical protein
MAVFADQFFSLRKEAKRGSVPKPPWTGLEFEAQVADIRNSHLLALKDYGPDWIHAWQQEKSTTYIDTTPNNSLQLNHDWQQHWADQYAEQTHSSPWLKTLKNQESSQSFSHKQSTRTETKQTSVEEPQDSLNSKTNAPLSPSELGLRFHALMEHGDEEVTHTSSFVNRFLNLSLVREHELELWGDFETDQSVLYEGKGLVATQRKILDVFCVIPASQWPKALMNLESVVVGQNETRAFGRTLQTAQEAEGWVHVIVDFKTGAPKEEHVTQMEKYLQWVKNLLMTHPELLVGRMTSGTLFASQVKPLVGILCYTGQIGNSLPDKFNRCLKSVDKNTSLLFVINE